MDHTLYFPYIDPQDNGVLNTSLLLWDDIYTIVPENLQQAYQNQVSSTLATEGILQEIRVDEHSRAVMKTADVVTEYLDNPKVQQLLLNSVKNKENISHIHPDKLAASLKEKINTLLKEDIFIEKNLSSSNYRMYTNDSFVGMEEGFTNFYMSVLANHVSEERGYGLTAETTLHDSIFSDLSLNIAKSQREHNAELVNGLMSYIMVEMPKIAANNDIDKLLNIRKTYEEERRELRYALQRLANSAQNLKYFQNPQDLTHTVKYIYQSEIKPGVDDLKRKLRSNNISFFISPFNLTGLTTLAGSIPFPIALSLTGLSVVLNGVNWWQNKQNAINESPYRYLMSIQKNR